MRSHPLHRDARTAWVRWGLFLVAVGVVVIAGTLYRPGLTDLEALVFGVGASFCAVGAWTIYRTSGRGIELHPDKLVIRNLFGTKQLPYGGITDLALYRMPVPGGGVLGNSTRMMAGGDTAVGVFIKTRRGKTHGMTASMHESWPEIVRELRAKTGIEPEELNDANRLEWIRGKP